VGKASDRFGNFPTFIFGSLFGMVMVVIYTNLGVTPLHIVILVNALMFLGIFSRMIPSQALMSAIPAPESRGSFMSVSSSLQQIAGGLASVVAGHIVVQRADGMLEYFDVLGYILVGSSAICMVMIYFINRMVMGSFTGKVAPAAPPAH
jgi:MFS family permease